MFKKTNLRKTSLNSNASKPDNKIKNTGECLPPASS